MTSCAAPTAADRAGDAAARSLAQREFERPLALAAGAGTGKTTVLTARIVTWALGPGWERALAEARAGDAPNAHEPVRIAPRVLAGIAAITFTEAAAAEMAERVERALREVAEGGRPEGVLPDALPADAAERMRRAEALRGALDHLVTRTIHAWCRRLLAQHPLEARLHPDFEVDATGRVQSEVVQEVIEQRLRAAYATREPSPFLDLAAEEQGAARLYAALSLLVDEGTRPGDLDFEPLAPARVRAWRGELCAAAQALAGFDDELRLPGSAPPEVAAFARETAQRTSECADDAEALQGLTDWLRDLWAERRKMLRDWSNGKIGANVRAQLGERASALEAAAQRLQNALSTALALHPRRLVAAHRAFRILLEEVEAGLQARRAVTFSALLRGARDLLRGSPRVAASVRRELAQLLVDEFQDTDALQCEVVRTIALEGPRSERPGLFVVGDAKQSIYGWRNADLGAYQDFLETLLEAGGRELELCVNFRSLPAILEEVQRVVEPVMHAERGLQPAFARLVPSEQNERAAGFARDEAAAVEHWVSWLPEGAGRTLSRTRSGDANAIEARALARDVRRLHEEHGVPLSQVALLLRTRSALDVYLEALREAELPYVVTGERSYYQRREVVEAAAALRCVLDANDHIALLAFLRSSIVGVPDAALIPLWARELPKLAGALHAEAPGVRDDLDAIEAIARDVAASLPPTPGLERIQGWESSLVDALAALAELRASFDADQPDRFVERLRMRLQAELSESGRFPAAFRVANLERFYRELASELAAGADERALLRRLRTAGEREREADEPVASVEDAVQVMTIHGAKGLGFEHVYVAQTHKDDKQRGSADAIALADEGVEYRLLGTQTLGFSELEAQRARVEAAERVRTLYVALTRAKQRVVVMGSWPADGAALKPPAHAKTHADLIAHRESRPRLLAEWMQACSERGECCVVDAAAVRWYFPALNTREVGVRRPVARVVADPARAEADLERLSAARELARERMSRPLHAPASREAHAALRDLLAEQRSGDAPRFEAEAEREGPLARGDAMRVGTAVHALLEDWDLDAPPGAELVRQRERLASLLATLSPGGAQQHEAQLAEARDLLDRFAGSPLFEKFVGLGDRVVARELPVWLPVAADEEGEQRGEGDPQPIVGFAAAIDLVYRDAGGRLVVVDYKSDRAPDERARRARAEAYASQGRRYVRALVDGLGLEQAPRFELWFLREGCVLEQET